MSASTHENNIRGPVFIVGMPRSGTKLMRTLLNQHPHISITLAESHFIPYFVRKFGNPPTLDMQGRMERFIDGFLRSAFFQTMRKEGYSFDIEQFASSVDPNSWNSIFEYIFKNFGSKKGTENIIWGDKTPGYVNHMALLKQIFPQAKFVHMIRDPRDYCLSVKKSWGKNIYRAADRWKTTIEKSRRYAETISADYREVHYEALLSETESIMCSISNFIGCDYDVGTTTLGISPEDVGDTKGRYGIVKDNTKKYLTQLSSKELERIEQIVGYVAEDTGYVLENTLNYKPLNRTSLWTFKFYDGFASLKYHIAKERSFLGGARRFFNHYQKSSWRVN